MPQDQKKDGLLWVGLCIMIVCTSLSTVLTYAAFGSVVGALGLTYLIHKIKG